MSTLASYGRLVTAGSRFTMYGGLSLACRYALTRCISEVLPLARDKQLLPAARRHTGREEQVQDAKGEMGVVRSAGQTGVKLAPSIARATSCKGHVADPPPPPTAPSPTYHSATATAPATAPGLGPGPIMRSKKIPAMATPRPPPGPRP